MFRKACRTSWALPHLVFLWFTQIWWPGFWSFQLHLLLLLWSWSLSSFVLIVLTNPPPSSSIVILLQAISPQQGRLSSKEPQQVSVESLLAVCSAGVLQSLCHSQGLNLTTMGLGKTLPSFSCSSQIVPPHVPVSTSWLFFSSQVHQTPHYFPMLAGGWGFKGQRPSWEQPGSGGPRPSDDVQMATVSCTPPPPISVFMRILRLANFEANVVCEFCFLPVFPVYSYVGIGRDLKNDALLLSPQPVHYFWCQDPSGAIGKIRNTQGV